jgi:methionyl-tRNA formyltransferase
MNAMKRRALFIGLFNPLMAGAMRGWLEAGNEIAGVWHAPAKGTRGGQGADRRAAWLSPAWSVRAIAKENGIPLRRIGRLADWPARLDEIRATGAEVLVSAILPQRLPDDILAHFGDRAVNLHPAPLPEFRGATVTLPMALEGRLQSDSAVTLHVMTRGFDEGPVIAIAPAPFDVATGLAGQRLAWARAARGLLAHALPPHLAGVTTPVPQDGARARYFGVGSVRAVVTGGQTGLAILETCSICAGGKPLPIEGHPGLRISGFDRVLGTATGQPARRSGSFLRPLFEMDAADCRVRLKVARPWSRPMARMRQIAVLLRARS